MTIAIFKTRCSKHRNRQFLSGFNEFLSAQHRAYERETTLNTFLAPPPSTSGPNPIASPFVQLNRTPLVPELILKSHSAKCAIDTRFRAAARLLQSLWLQSENIPTISSHRISSSSSHNAGTSFGSILNAKAARAGRNFLDPAIHRLVLQELLMREDGAAIDEERLFSNALSSMPLAFNLFAPLALDLDFATDVFRRLLPDFVHTVEQITFEHSPGRRQGRFLADRTAFDLAVRVTDLDGQSGTIFIEVKYSESMEGPAARVRDRYNEASKQTRLYRDPESIVLRSFPIEQLWREHLLAQLTVENGITPRAVFMAIGPQLNRRVQDAFRIYEAELIGTRQDGGDRVPFVPLTLETVILCISEAGDARLAKALWRRYCDFAWVARVVMQELVGEETPSQETTGDVKLSGLPSLPPGHQRALASGRSNARSAGRQKRKTEISRRKRTKV